MHTNSLSFNLPAQFRSLILGLLFSFLAPVVALADSAGQAPDEALVALLDEFLAGASNNDIAVHQRFWSDDLVYTSSTGQRFGKADILGSMESAGQDADSKDAEEPAMEYGREALLVRVYDDVAVITFRLVGTRQSEPPSTSKFYNTGTFLLRDGEWRAIAWQATRIPEES